ncbi:hypothetical protein E2C01_050050 [Portunus trituberculatus]|uniref:Uncharacterized protein n=1 Tax=Portunus trituberculatus TaxID=210409 RepID=A0A5B7GG73_PORTR|nr:hypothetical protein [Portunus trituberculatus]
MDVRRGALRGTARYSGGKLFTLNIKTFEDTPMSRADNKEHTQINQGCRHSTSVRGDQADNTRLPPREPHWEALSHIHNPAPR